MFDGWLTSFSLFLQSALTGMADPWVIALALVLTTFVVEDVAIAAALVLAAQGAISFPLAFGAVAGGIAVGDMGLYGLGRLARTVPALRRRLLHRRVEQARDLLCRRLITAVILARAIPGLRLVTYALAGYLGVSAPRFLGLVCVAVLGWTAALFWLGATVGNAIALATGLPVAVAVAIPIIVVAVLPSLWSLLARRSRRPA